MRVTVFGAAGPTGQWACLLALAAGHEVRAVSRRDSRLALPVGGAWEQVRADAQSGAGSSREKPDSRRRPR